MTSPARLRLPAIPGARRFTGREIAAASAAARADLERIRIAGLEREAWHAIIGRRPAADPDDDITTLTIWTLETAWAEMKPMARSIAVRGKRGRW